MGELEENEDNEVIERLRKQKKKKEDNENHNRKIVEAKTEQNGLKKKGEKTIVLNDNVTFDSSGKIMNVNKIKTEKLPLLCNPTIEGKECYTGEESKVKQVKKKNYEKGNAD